MVIKKGSMLEVIGSINSVLSTDEELLRYLWYAPEDVTGKDPLDETLLNIKDMANYWDIVNERIVLAEKVDDLVLNPICRLYVSAGRRRGVFNNYLLASQEIVISIYVHEDYEYDGRSMKISDRINELIALEHLKGSIGRIDFVAGNPRGAPTRYSKYEVIYEFTASKK